MPTVIDSLIIELGFDPAKLTKGQKEAVKAVEDGQKAMEKAAKAQEASNKRAAESFQSVTKEALTLFAVLTGTKSVVDFAGQMMAADAALGRFAANLGETPQVVGAWEAAAERMGGTSAATASTLERMNKQLYDLHRNGQMLPKEFSQLSAATGRRIDTEDGVDKYMLDIAGAAHQLAQTDMVRAHMLLSGMGIDDATANAMVKYGDAFGKYLNTLQKNQPSAETIKNMQELQDQWVGLQQSGVSLANTIAGQLEPVLGPLLVSMTNWIQKNKDWVASDIIKDVEIFATDADHVAKALGGWENATEILFALWTGSKIVEVLANVRLLATGATAGAAGLSSILGLLGIAGVLGVDAYNNTVKQAGAGEAGDLANLGWREAAQGFQPGDVFDGTNWHKPGAAANNNRGSSASASSMSDYIRQRAAAMGIDPDVALRVASSEGLNSYTGDNGSSFGPFQLHYGGMSSQFPHAGLGDEFTKSTGMDARDPSTWKAQVDYALQWAHDHGWNDWSGAKAQGIYGKYGIGAVPAAGLAAGASGAAALSNVQQSHQVTTNNSASQVHVGTVNVTSNVSDPNLASAQGVESALRRSQLAWAANSGIQ